MKTLMRGYFISSHDMYLLDDLIKGIPTHMDNEDAVEELIQILQSRTPIIIQLEEEHSD